MTATRPTWPAAALLIVALCALAGPDPARADASRLDENEVAHLAGLDILGGRALEPHMVGGRAVLVALFASWCQPCNTVFERLKLLEFSHAAEGLTIVAVSLREERSPTPDEDTARLERFIGRHAPVFPVLRGTGETAALFGAGAALPAIAVYDRGGRRVYAFAPESGKPEKAPSLEALRGAVRNALGVGAARRNQPGSAHTLRDATLRVAPQSL